MTRGRPRTVSDDQILSTLARLGPTKPGKLAGALHMHRNGLAWRIRQLLADGRVERQGMAYVAAGEAPRPERPAAPSMRQLIEIADAAWQWEVIDEVPNDTIDEILDRLRVALKGYRPRHIHPALMQFADRVIR
jgi:DNA-binding HxlR family transcriptional regulator